MFKKFATATIISAEIATKDGFGLVKAAHRAVFNYTPREGYLYVRSRMISSRCNDNYDEFPAEEIRSSWKTAIGKPAFVNHHNEDHRRMRGVIIDAALHEDTLPDGRPDIWIEALHEIDAKRFPKLAEAIVTGRVNRTSMGCDVGFSVCSACNNKASTPAEYCEHIPRMKGKILYRHTASGQREGHLIREICHKIAFFENSFLVEDPADPTAVVTGVDTRGIKSTAAMDRGQPFMVQPKGNKWLVVDAQGKTRGEHATEGDAKVHQATLYSSLPEAGDISGNTNPTRSPDTATEIVRARMATRKTAALKTLAELSDDDITKGLGMPTSEQGRADIRDEEAKNLADQLAAPMYEPYGGRENYHLHLDNKSMQHLQDRYRGGTGRFAFDEEAEKDGERAEPYYEIKHTTPQGRHTGWSIRHYADGPMAEIRHEATPGEGHDVIDIGRELDHSTHNPFNRHQPPDNFGHNELAGELHNWLNDEEMGYRDHLEGPHGDPRIRRFKQRYPDGKIPPRTSKKLAYGETKAPADVDTLRMDTCPVCGESDSFDGDRCQVCNFVQPPAMFQDPDTGVARQMDLKQEPFDAGMVGPNGMPLPNVDTQQQAMEGVPGTPDDGIADLFCPACGFSADTQAPETNNDPSMPSITDQITGTAPENSEEPKDDADGDEEVAEDPAEEPAQDENPEAPSGPPADTQGLQEGDVCPNCGQATMLSPNDIGEMGGEVPQEVASDADADGIPDAAEADEDKDGIPDDAEDADQDGVPDDAEPDLDGDGVPDDAEGEDAPEGPEDEGDEVEDADAVQDEDEPKKGRKESSRRAPRRGSERETMTKKQAAATGAPSETAALQALGAIVKKQQIVITAQQIALETQEQKLHYLANLAGVANEFNAMTREGSRKIADIMNPAQPIPDPGDQGPTETTQEAATPETYDDPRNPGITPGSVNGVPAQMTDSPLTPGVTLPTSPYSQMVDVTAPVGGTEMHVPLEQTKIETDVRIGDPMAGAGTPMGTAFPLNPEFAADGASYANQVNGLGLPTQAQASNRTMASLRLAKLRKNAGLLGRGEDEFVAAAGIEKAAHLSTEMIEHEIGTLTALAQQRRPRTAPATRPAAERLAPSLAAMSTEASNATVGTGFDAADASDLFLD